MKLLVTGGAGFLGSHFVRSVLGGTSSLEASRVTVLDKLAPSGTFGALGPVAEDSRLDFVPGDTRDPATVDPVVRGADAIVHFATAEVTDVVGTQILLDAAVRHGTSRFTVVSTGEVYGPGSLTEDAVLSPASPYAAAKATGDLLALACHRTHGLPVVVTRGADTHGPFQHPSRLVAGFVTDLLRGRTAPLPGDGRTVRDRLHVDDHCRGIALATTAGKPGEIYHFAGTPGLSDRDLAAKLLDLCDAGWHRVTTGAPAPTQQHFALDDTKTRRELGYAPRIDLDDGLAQTVAWYRANEPWWRPLVSD